MVKGTGALVRLSWNARESVPVPAVKGTDVLHAVPPTPTVALVGSVHVGGGAAAVTVTVRVVPLRLAVTVGQG
jgi:hypothetical protein